MVERIRHSSGLYGSEKASNSLLLVKDRHEDGEHFMSFLKYFNSPTTSSYLVSVNLISEFQRSQLDNREKSGILGQGSTNFL